jgi:predicted dehydrogenase/nucleoside-diphosphate-sugar epimerase
MGVHHARAIQSCGNAQLVAVADPGVDWSMLESVLPPGVERFRSAAELLASAKPDVVHIVTPPSMHVELAKLCLAHGAHTYVEKPFTLTAEDAVDILDAARRAGRSVCAGHQLLFEAPVRALAASRHLIGQVVHIESYFAFRTVRKSPEGRSLMSPVEQLLDILAHPVYTLVDALRTSEPDEQPELTSLQVRAEGDVHALLRAGDTTATLVVTLRGRPVDSYLRVVGTNGSLRADFVRGALIKLPGAGASSIALAANPYREAWQILVGSTRGFAARLRAKKKGYPGVTELVEAFYDAILHDGPPPISAQSILDTVRICEIVGRELWAAEHARERRAEEALVEKERVLPTPAFERGVVLVTGGTGLLGRAVIADLRRHDWAVRAISRRVPPPSVRKPGVEYVAADLSRPLARAVFAGVATVVHCAAETAGGKEAHERNTIQATRHLLREAAAAGVTNFLHVSSLAVLKPGKTVGGLVDERTPVDYGNPARGPYVWAKAECEREVVETAPALGIKLRVIRPGPLVDFDAFEPPGRLGRELGPIYVAVGPRLGVFSLCDVRTAAQVICAAVADFDATPPVVNLVEPEPPTRAELLVLYLRRRPDLAVFWIPGWVPSVISPLAKVIQRLLRPRATPVDLAAAFSSERYDATVAAQLIRRARSAA